MFILTCCILFMIAELIFTYFTKFYKKPSDGIIILSCVLTASICCMIVFGYEMKSIIPNDGSYLFGFIFNIGALPAGFLVSYIILLAVTNFYNKICSIIRLCKIKSKKRSLKNKGDDKFYTAYISYCLYDDILSNNYICSDSKIYKKVEFILNSIKKLTENSSVYNNVALEILKSILNLANMYEYNINIIPNEINSKIKLSKEEINKQFMDFLEKTEKRIVEIINNTLNYNNLKIDREAFVLNEQIEILKK